MEEVRFRLLLKVGNSLTNRSSEWPVPASRWTRVLWVQGLDRYPARSCHVSGTPGSRASPAAAAARWTLAPTRCWCDRLVAADPSSSPGAWNDVGLILRLHVLVSLQSHLLLPWQHFHWRNSPSSSISAIVSVCFRLLRAILRTPATLLNRAQNSF